MWFIGKNHKGGNSKFQKTNNKQIPNNNDRNSKQIAMKENSESPRYDLEERTFQFAKNTTGFCKKLPKTISNIEYIKQLIKASGSVASNYIEANESLSKKDFKMRIKICRKEAKESTLWLRLIIETNESKNQQEGRKHLQEATELKKIFSSILNNSK